MEPKKGSYQGADLWPHIPARMLGPSEGMSGPCKMMRSRCRGLAKVRALGGNGEWNSVEEHGKVGAKAYLLQVGKDGAVGAIRIPYSLEICSTFAGCPPQ